MLTHKMDSYEIKEFHDFYVNLQQGRFDGHILHIIGFCLIEHIITRNVIAERAALARHFMIIRQNTMKRFECQIPHVDMSEVYQDFMLSPLKCECLS